MLTIELDEDHFHHDILSDDVQRVHPVPVGGVHVRPRVEQELDELDVAARKRVVERGASAPMLPVVGVGAALDEPRRYLQPRLLVHDRVALAGRDLVQPAIKVALGHTYAGWRGLEDGAAGRRAVQGCAGGSGRGRAHTLSEEFLDNVTLEAANCPDERVFVVLGRWRGRRVG